MFHRVRNNAMKVYSSELLLIVKMGYSVEFEDNLLSEDIELPMSKDEFYEDNSQGLIRIDHEYYDILTNDLEQTGSLVMMLMILSIEISGSLTYVVTEV